MCAHYYYHFIGGGGAAAFKSNSRPCSMRFFSPTDDCCSNTTKQTHIQFGACRGVWCEYGCGSERFSEPQMLAIENATGDSGVGSLLLQLVFLFLSPGSGEQYSSLACLSVPAEEKC